MSRVLVLSPRRLGGYRDLVIADARDRGEHPIALAPISDDDRYIAAASRWIEVCERVVVYGDFPVEEAAHGVVEEAAMVGVSVVYRRLGARSGSGVALA